MAAINLKQLIKEESNHNIFKDNFENLPEKIPYGFWIAPDGSFAIVKNMFCHEKIIRNVIPGIDISNYESTPLLNGFIAVSSGADVKYDIQSQRLIISNDKIGLKYWAYNSSHKALQTLKDLAEWYSVQLYKINVKMVNGKIVSY